MKCSQLDQLVEHVYIVRYPGFNILTRHFSASCYTLTGPYNSLGFKPGFVSIQNGWTENGTNVPFWAAELADQILTVLEISSLVMG